MRNTKQEGSGLTSTSAEDINLYVSKVSTGFFSLGVWIAAQVTLLNFSATTSLTFSTVKLFWDLFSPFCISLDVSAVNHESKVFLLLFTQ